MRKLLLILLLVALPTEAKPWYRDKKNWLMLGASVGASLYATHNGHTCRQRVGLDGCTMAGYGEFRSREILRGGIALGTAALSIKMHQEGYREWFIWGAGDAAFNASIAAHNSFKKGNADGSSSDRRISLH